MAIAWGKLPWIGVIAVGMIAVSTAQGVADKRSTKISSGLLRVATPLTQDRGFMSKARGASDEMDECMNNPDNAHIEFTERLAACFCLSVDNAPKGCQSAD